MDGRVKENTAPGPIVTIGANDPENQPLSYSIVSGNDQGDFSIDQMGTISSTVSFDAETTTLIRTLEVQISDGVNTVTTIASITIENVNEGPTQITPLTIEVVEGQSASISAVNAFTDPDGDTVSVLLATAGANSLGVSHNGTVVTYIHDGSETTSDTFQISVHDGNGNVVPATVTVTIIPSNDAPAIQAQLSIPEALEGTTGRHVHRLRAIDPDGPTEIWTIIGGDPDDKFVIIDDPQPDGYRFRIQIVKPLDFDLQPRHELVVELFDGIQTTQRTIIVDVAENLPPEIDQAADQNLVAGAPFTVDIPVRDEFLDLATIDTIGLPAGLSINLDDINGIATISGKTTSAALKGQTVPVTVELTDAATAAVTPTTATMTFNLVFASDIVISPHAGQIVISEVLYAESEKYDPADPLAALVMDEFIEFTNLGPAIDIENFWVSDTRFPTVSDDLSFHPVGPIQPDTAGRIFQAVTQSTFLANGDVITAPIRRPGDGTYQLQDGSTRPAAPFQFRGTDYGFAPGPNSSWEAFNDSGDDIWFWDDQDRLVAYVAWDDGTGTAHISTDRPDPSWGVWNVADEARLAGAAPGQSISLVGPNNDSGCWELTDSNTATCSGAATSANKDGGFTTPTGRVSSQGLTNS